MKAVQFILKTNCQKPWLNWYICSYKLIINQDDSWGKLKQISQSEVLFFLLFNQNYSFQLSRSNTNVPPLLRHPNFFQKIAVLAPFVCFGNNSVLRFSVVHGFYVSTIGAFGRQWLSLIQFCIIQYALPCSHSRKTVYVDLTRRTT